MRSSKSGDNQPQDITLAFALLGQQVKKFSLMRRGSRSFEWINYNKM